MTAKTGQEVKVFQMLNDNLLDDELKDAKVVLFRDYEKLRRENEQLKKDLCEQRGYNGELNKRLQSSEQRFEQKIDEIKVFIRDKVDLEGQDEQYHKLLELLEQVKKE